MISSRNAVLFAYILYLLGRTELKFAEPELRKLIARWFFVTSMTGRFTNSPESKMEADLAKLRNINDQEDFRKVLDEICGEIATPDYWNISLPSLLATSSARSPSMFAYFASLCLLEADVLFSKQKVAELLDSSTNEPREPIERHHLFPQAHLESIGKRSPREKNQIANYALIQWGDNGRVGGAAPCEYLPIVEKGIPHKTLERQYYWHALPDGWASLDYDVFLRQRRELIAKVVLDAYKLLESGEVNRDGGSTKTINQLIDDGESTSAEFKSTLRRNLHTGENDIKIENAALKTIAAFLNSKGGGTLILGVADDGEPLGLENDAFPNNDKMLLHLNNLVRGRLGSKHFLYIQPHFDDLDGKSVLVVDCLPARSPAYLRDGSEERFYIRSVAATVELKGSQIQDYVALRFR